QCHHVWLGDGLTKSDGQRRVVVRLFHALFGHEKMARQGAHGCLHTHVFDAPVSQLVVDHLGALHQHFRAIQKHCHRSLPVHSAAALAPGCWGDEIAARVCVSSMLAEVSKPASASTNRARSARASIPTRRPSSTTGTRRTCRCRISEATSASVSLGETLATCRDMVLSTLIADSG